MSSSLGFTNSHMRPHQRKKPHSRQTRQCKRPARRTPRGEELRAGGERRVASTPHNREYPPAPPGGQPLVDPRFRPPTPDAVVPSSEPSLNRSDECESGDEEMERVERAPTPPPRVVARKPKYRLRFTFGKFSRLVHLRYHGGEGVTMRSDKRSHQSTSSTANPCVFFRE